MSSEPPPATLMTRDEVDRAIAEIEAARGIIARTLLTVDDHPANRFLREYPVRGRTLEVWDELQPKIQVLWAHYSLLNNTLQEIQRIRERRDRPGHQKQAELTRLLRDDAIELCADGMPVESVTDVPAERLSLAGLVERLEKASDDMVVALTRFDEANRGVTSRLSALAAALSQVRAQAATLGVRQDAGLGHLVSAFAEVGRSAVDDPLGVADSSSTADGTRAGAVDAGLREIEAEVQAVGRQLSEVAAVRQAFSQRLAALQRLVSAVASAEEKVGRTYATVTAKIAMPGLTPHIERLPELRAGLAGLERYGRAHRWQLIAEELPVLERIAGEALTGASDRAEEAGTLLARREELRGRLDSYRVKADRLGLGEHSELTRLYRDARDLLWSAPCDLRAATSTVHQYKDRLAALLESEGGAAR
jgi:hypothetical protein